MKIAIPILGDTEISAHFGRSPAFLVITVEQGQIRHREIRANDQAGSGLGQHEPSPDSAHPLTHSHDHNRFVQLLGDCRAVVGLGMGAGARRALESAGLEVRLLAVPCPPEEAALEFASGRLESSPDLGCACSGHRHT